MLPAGYVIRKDKGAAAESSEDEDNKITMEQEIEEERALLDSTKCTPVTLASFNAWKERKVQEKQAALEAKIKAEEAKGKKDKSQMAFMSGRALFDYNPDMFEDDEGADTEIVFEEDEEQKEDDATQASQTKSAAAAGA